VSDSNEAAAEDAPLVHESALRVLGLLEAPDSPLAEETPLFAAERGFAAREGGPLTRAFLAAIPWADELIVDSSLVWLMPGLAHGFPAPHGRRGPRAPLRFLHEPFPGCDEGVRGAANRNRAARHWLCVLGHEATPEAALGTLAFERPDLAAEFWFPREGFELREAEVERRLLEGSLRREPLPRRALVEFGWGTLLRWRPAASTGFQFVLRATAGAERPAVNGRRNLSMV